MAPKKLTAILFDITIFLGNPKKPKKKKFCILPLESKVQQGIESWEVTEQTSFSSWFVVSLKSFVDWFKNWWFKFKASSIYTWKMSVHYEKQFCNNMNNIENLNFTVLFIRWLALYKLMIINILIC